VRGIDVVLIADETRSSATIPCQPPTPTELAAFQLTSVLMLQGTEAMSVPSTEGQRCVNLMLSLQGRMQGLTG
jgi:hypothetical protein